MNRCLKLPSPRAFASVESAILNKTPTSVMFRPRSGVISDVCNSRLLSSFWTSRGVSSSSGFPGASRDNSNWFTRVSRSFSSSAKCLAEQASFSTEGEKNIHETLKEKFPLATEVQVQDISGGCGSMYEIYITSAEFKGKKTVLQHRMVNDALAQEIKDMHGLRIFTSLPS